MIEPSTPGRRWKKVIIDSLIQAAILTPVLLLMDWLGLLP